MKKIVLLLAVFLVLSGCAQQETNTSETGDANAPIENINDGGVDAMASGIVEEGDTIKVEYKGTFPDTGEVFDKSEGRGPLEFTAGAGQMITGFDKAVIGMKLNEEKTITLKPEDAYGNETLKIEVPVEELESHGIAPIAGAIVSMSTGATGKITEVKGGTATLEFPNNHSLAGKTLQFWIKVVEISKK